MKIITRNGVLICDHLKNLLMIWFWIIAVLFFFTPYAAEAKKPDQRARELILEGNRLCAQEGKCEEAVKLYRKAMDKHGSVDAAYNLGVTYEIELGDPEQALLHYRLFLNMEPNSADAREVKKWLEELKIGYPELNTGPYPVKSLSELPPDLRRKVEKDLLEGNRLYREENYQKAKDKYEEILRYYNSADVYYNLGLISTKLGDNSNAMLYYQQFLKLEPKSQNSAQVRKWIKKYKQEKIWREMEQYRNK